MGCKVALGDACSFSRGASVPRDRMFDTGKYLYIHYGDLYKGFDLRIDVEDPVKPIPYILGDEKVKDMPIYSTILRANPPFRGLRRQLFALSAATLLCPRTSTIS